VRTHCKKKAEDARARALMGQPLRGGEKSGGRQGMRTHGTAAAISVIPCFAMFTRWKLLPKIFGVSPVGNPDEGGLERCTSGYCLFEIRILA
jgi:hypothetical protein